MRRPRSLERVHGKRPGTRLHVPTSTHAPPAPADCSALFDEVHRAAPVGEGGQPLGRRARYAVVAVGDEAVDVLRIPLGMTGGCDDEARGEPRWIGGEHDRLVAPANRARANPVPPARTGRSRARAAALDDQRCCVRATPGHDHHSERMLDSSNWTSAMSSFALVLLRSRTSPRTDDAFTGDELDEVELSANRCRRMRGAATRGRVESPVGVARVHLEIGAVDQVQPPELVAVICARNSRDHGTGSGTGSGTARMVPAARCVASNSSADSPSRVSGFSQMTRLRCSNAIVASVAGRSGRTGTRHRRPDWSQPRRRSETHGRPRGGSRRPRPSATTPPPQPGTGEPGRGARARRPMNPAPHDRHPEVRPAYRWHHTGDLLKLSRQYFCT